jgi:hypothetical protein
MVRDVADHDSGHSNVLSRRKFLTLSGGGVAVVWAGSKLVLPRLSPSATTPAAPVAPVVGPGSTPSLRALPFSDDFANSALPEWNVRRPVAILGTTPYGFRYPATEALDRTDFLHGRGTVIGLDGPRAGASGPGLIETVDTFVFEPGSTYTLKFRVAGSHQSSDRLPPSTVTASLPGLGVSKTVTRQPHDDFLEFPLEVPVTSPATSTIAFASQNAPGQAGLLLESVSLAKAG